METCFEYLGCKKKDCIMYGISDKYCWETEGTLCNHKGIEMMQEKLSEKRDACVRSGCVYYKVAKNKGLV